MAAESRRLSKPAYEAILRAKEAKEKSGVAIATITLWELAWLVQHRRIIVNGTVESFVRETVSRVAVKPMSPEITALAVRLPETFPKDPADRVIVATAMIDGMTLVTADTAIRKSKIVETLW
jgi:PIN domain nuclease of toxin-antitoxin system